MALRWDRTGVRLACLLLALGGAGCGLTHRARGVKPSGFLGDYSQLREGASDEALMVYFKPGTNWGAYSKVMIDPVTLWMSPESKMAKVPAQDRQALANYLYLALKNQLGQDFTIVQAPGPGVLRLRAALTEMTGSRVALDTISSIMPQMRVVSVAKRLVTGTHAFVGSATAEAEVLDSTTGTRLLAGVDRRAGRKRLRGATGTWSDVEEAFDHWAKRLRTRLAELRSTPARP